MGAAASWLAATGTVGVIVVAVSGIALAAGIYVASRRNAVTAANVNDVAARPPRRRPRRLTRREPSVHIDWATLAAIAVVAAAAALTVVLLVAFALVALSGPLRAAGRRPGRRRRVRHPHRRRHGRRRALPARRRARSSATACT